MVEAPWINYIGLFMLIPIFYGIFMNISFCVEERRRNRKNKDNG